MADMTCEHGHLLGACEDCAYEAARAAGRACPALLRRRRAQTMRAAGSRLRRSTPRARTRRVPRSASPASPDPDTPARPCLPSGRPGPAAGGRSRHAREVVPVASVPRDASEGRRGVPAHPSDPACARPPLPPNVAGHERGEARLSAGVRGRASLKIGPPYHCRDVRHTPLPALRSAAPRRPAARRLQSACAKRSPTVPPIACGVEWSRSRGTARPVSRTGLRRTPCRMVSRSPRSATGGWPSRITGWAGGLI